MSSTASQERRFVLPTKPLSIVDAAHPELPLALANDMRNALAHGYFKVDLEIVWKTIQSNLPDLHAQITEVSATLSRNSDHEGMEP